MIEKIKKRIDNELRHYLIRLNSRYSLSSISRELYEGISEFLCRSGKRLRPTLFIVAYLGFARRPARRLYESALSLELLHDFMLVHDDIIDKTRMRRGRPSLHVVLQRHLKKFPRAKFSGEDLAIVCGDAIYALALNAFLAIEEDKARKEEALKKLIEATLYTASGEFLELIRQTQDVAKVSLAQIFRVYDLKTANYTFSSPLSIGAILGGADKYEQNILSAYGLCLGRAFQIKDDILGLFGKESETGKPDLTDLKEGKRTLLIWHAFRRACPKDKAEIKRLLGKNSPSRLDLLMIRTIVLETKALDCAKREIHKLISRSERIIRRSQIKPFWKRLLQSYAEKILSV